MYVETTILSDTSSISNPFLQCTSVPSFQREQLELSRLYAAPDTITWTSLNSRNHVRQAGETTSGDVFTLSALRATGATSQGPPERLSSPGSGKLIAHPSVSGSVTDKPAVYNDEIGEGDASVV